WGNFFNAEAYGTTTDLPWGMVIRKSIQTTGAAVHPTFLYESLWNAIGFIILHNYSKKRKFKGEMTLLYIAWYGLGRAFIEGLRIDSLMIGNTNIRVSQVLAAVTCVIATAALLYLYKTKKGIPVFAVEGMENAEEIAEVEKQEVSEEMAEEIVSEAEETDTEEIHQ
ncbi:MAG: prolipoprotein diacylglyceryl transferase, partial [Clostridia bacterium]|nr:prolipoprotein diacylglyceryl transferase [Clostridia bacterium]